MRNSQIIKLVSVFLSCIVLAFVFSSCTKRYSFSSEENSLIASFNIGREFKLSDETKIDTFNLAVTFNEKTYTVPLIFPVKYENCEIVITNSDDCSFTLFFEKKSKNSIHLMFIFNCNGQSIIYSPNEENSNLVMTTLIIDNISYNNVYRFECFP